MSEYNLACSIIKKKIRGESYYLVHACGVYVKEDWS
jgi:hypothetical protein